MPEDLKTLEGWTVLVLGGTGLIGAHVVRSVVARGGRVRVLVRPGSRRDVVDGLPGVAFVDGDLFDPPSLKAAASGCQILIHAAAPYPRSASGRASLLEAARRSMENVLAAVRSRAADDPPSPPLSRAPVPGRLVRAVYVSSYSTIASNGGPTTPADEQGFHVTPPDGAAYFEVKELMERMARNAARNEGLPIVIVNPSFVIDAYDPKPTTGRFLIAVLKKRMPVLLTGFVNAVAGSDVGEGVVLAALNGCPGERYILGNENMTLDELVRRVARVGHVAPPGLRIPMALAEGMAWISEGIASLTPGKTPVFPINGLRMLKRMTYLDSSRAERELGWERTPVDPAIQRAVAWLRADGMI
jgi:dihydroflavonol-4-reductase